MTSADVAAYLDTYGPLTAAEVAQRMDVDEDTLYGLLVAAEARGLARVLVVYNPAPHKGVQCRLWDGMVG